MSPPPAVAQLPLSATWLDAIGVGRMIGATPRQVRERIALRPDFPKAARIGGTGHPRWNAAEVDAWMRRQRHAPFHVKQSLSAILA